MQVLKVTMHEEQSVQECGMYPVGMMLLQANEVIVTACFKKHHVSPRGKVEVQEKSAINVTAIFSLS